MLAEPDVQNLVNEVNLGYDKAAGISILGIRLTGSAPFSSCSLKPLSSRPQKSISVSRAARIPCYTGAMEKTRQNVTLVVEEDLLLAARKVALDQRTSVNQLVRGYLAALVEEPSQRCLARARLRKAFETGLVDVGDRKWSRDELYDR